MKFFQIKFFKVVKENAKKPGFFFSVDNFDIVGKNKLCHNSKKVVVNNLDNHWILVRDGVNSCCSNLK